MSSNFIYDCGPENEKPAIVAVRITVGKSANDDDYFTEWQS